LRNQYASRPAREGELTPTTSWRCIRRPITGATNRCILLLFLMGHKDAARKQFATALTLAPGNQLIEQMLQRLP
jgi:hypothetical protein